MPSRQTRLRERSPASARALHGGVVCLLLALAAPRSQAESIVGVCPDGSVFVVQRAEQVPCSRAREVEAHEVPPMRPELLPRPYTWQVYNESVDPNNPYNALDAARQVRELQAGVPAPSATPTPPVGAGPQHAAPQSEGGRAPFEPVSPDALGLTDGEVRDLFLIVELSQDHAPAAFVKETADGRERLRVSLAHSAAFQDRFAAARPGAPLGGEVLLFTVVAKRAEPFHANFTLTQGHFAYQPDAGDADQLGVVHGRLGELGAGEVVLGYLVVPDRIDLARPVDVYWNDRHTTATFTP